MPNFQTTPMAGSVRANRPGLQSLNQPQQPPPNPLGGLGQVLDFFNPFHSSNPLNQAVTRGANDINNFTNSLFGGLNPANNPYGPALQPTEAQINGIIDQMRQMGLTDDQIGNLTNQFVGPNARMTPEAALANARSDAIGNQFSALQQQLQAGQDETKRQYESALGEFNQGLGGIQTRAQGQFDRYSNLSRDPNSLRSDWEYSPILAQVENQTLQAEQQARREASDLTANRGAGFSGASQLAALSARNQGQNLRQAELSRARTDAGNRAESAQSVLDQIPGLRLNAQQGTYGALDSSRNAAIGLNASLGGQRYSMLPDYSGQLGDITGYRAAQQGYGQGQAGNLVGMGLTGLGILANGGQTGANQFMSFLKK